MPEGALLSSPGVEALFQGLDGPDLLTRMSWEEWLSVTPPYPVQDFTAREVTRRYARNGYDWDIHGTLLTPTAEAEPGLAFVIFHGGAGSERGKDETPDGRPGLARVLAGQGFSVLSVTYPGHYPPGGEWQTSIAERAPVYLLDRELSDDEIRDRNRKCTFNVILQGAGELVDAHLGGYNLLAFGHSTGGPMAAHLTRFISNAKVIGIVGYGSGGPDGWRGQWRDATGAESYKEQSIDYVAHHTAEDFQRAGYECPGELTPWGGAREYAAWGTRVRSQMKTGLCYNQHRACLEALKTYPALTGLPLDEFIDHLQDPDAGWLSTIGVLLLVGENDRGHWLRGERTRDKREMYMTARYAEHTDRAHLVVVPRLGHFGFAALHHEPIAYLWLWALKRGYFAIPDGLGGG